MKSLRQLHSLLFAISALALPLSAWAQTTPDTSQFRILKQTVVRKNDGGTVTFNKVAPPVLPQLAPAPSPPLTAAATLRQRELEGKNGGMLSISATVHAGGITELRWGLNGWTTLRALSNVDFMLLEGTGSVETADKYYTLVMGLGRDSQPLSPADAALAMTLPHDGRASFVLTENKTTKGANERQALEAMQTLHDWFGQNQIQVTQQHAQQLARRRALPKAPPPKPTNTVIHFWRMPDNAAVTPASTGGSK